MRARVFGLLSLAIVFNAAPAVAKDAWSQFDRDSKRFCPSHHLEWLPDIWSDLPGEFEKTLPPQLQRRVTAISDFKRCSKETMGFYCEGMVGMEAYRRLGILEQFTHYACNRFVCTEGSICSDKEHP